MRRGGRGSFPGVLQPAFSAKDNHREQPKQDQLKAVEAVIPVAQMLRLQSRRLPPCFARAIAFNEANQRQQSELYIAAFCARKAYRITLSVLRSSYRRRAAARRPLWRANCGDNWLVRSGHSLRVCWIVCEGMLRVCVWGGLSENPSKGLLEVSTAALAWR